MTAPDGSRPADPQPAGPQPAGPQPADPQPADPRDRVASRSLNELAMGFRMAATGGRDSLTRALLTAVGVALGVAMLLLASSIPAMMQGRQARSEARFELAGGPQAQHRTDRTLLIAYVDTSYHGEEVRGRLIQPEGAKAVPPPGLDRYPAPGQMVVSPALKRLLASPEGKLLRERLNHPVAGVIGRAGLVGPSEYAYYLGGEHLAAGGTTQRISGFGQNFGSSPLSPDLAVLGIVGCVVLLLPIGVFIASAVRFGGEQRDRRLAALRLVGADRRTTERIAAGEAMVGAGLGVLLGAGLFLAVRPLIERFSSQGYSFYASDVTPSPVLTVLVLVAVPVLAVLVTRLAMRRVAVEPLGVVRRAGGSRRRMWWRIALPVLGLLLLSVAVKDPQAAAGGRGRLLLIAGVILALIGVTALLPWTVDAVVRRVGGFGGVSWQLAVRRLGLSSDAATRTVNGIAVTVAGGIALQSLLTGLDGNYGAMVDEQARYGTYRTTAYLDPVTGQVPSAHRAGQIAARFRADPAVAAAVGFADVPLAGRGDSAYASARIADCAALRLVAVLPDCRDGDVFTGFAPSGRAGGADRKMLSGGSTVHLGYDEGGPAWQVPAARRSVVLKQAQSADALGDAVLLLTPRAADRTLLAASDLRVLLRLRAGTPDAFERVLNVAATVDPRMRAWTSGELAADRHFTGIKRALLAGTAALLLLIGASMLVGMLEQFRDRKRVLAVLAAFGTRRGTMAVSVFWQALLPVLIGTVIAFALGLALGGVLLKLLSYPVAYDWGSVLGISGLGGAVVLLVTVVTLPVLWRMMRPSGLRYE
ncbi:FtsX-like permease family protein [Streptomyces sp. NPDC092296]|uniref:FtsX-like permease family protein n=1 Tax=Streptomyces sp. NPDC092296 TaxID=3366012 RepID=UPI003812F984